MSVEVDIHEAIFDALVAADIAPIAWPNVYNDGTTPFLRVHILPSNTYAFGMVSTDVYQGIVQVDVYVPEGTGEIDAVSLASSVLAVFPRNSYIKRNDTLIKFNQSGSIFKNAYQVGGIDYAQPQPNTYMLHVSIPYIVIN